MNSKNNNLNIEIGNRLNALRQNRKLSQERFITELAENNVLIITKSAYSRYECGETPIPVSSLKAFCDYFNVTTDYLICGTEKEKMPPDEGITKVLKLFSSKDKDIVCRFMADIANCIKEK